MYSKIADVRCPVRVGLAGTGYVAKLRTEFLLQDERSHLVAVVGNTQEKTQIFANNYQIEAISSWQDLVEREDIDLVVICNVNRDHGAIASSALSKGKHVIVEYPICLDPQEAEELIALSKANNKLLHVEHIELLGGMHQALKQHLPEVGEIFYVRYSTINPQHPAPRKWTYNHELFGFPLVGALSRLHRLVDLFGKVSTVNCHNRFWQTEAEYYQACLCTAQLNLKSGLLAQVIYGKGETLWQAERKFEVHGEHGALIFDGEQGFIVQGEQKVPIEVGTRRGLFAKDTSLVLDHLINGTPLYITPEESLYTLKVADAARRSANTGETTIVSETLDEAA
ncbi:Gfo/Idh/MocA family oxidoreductase [Aetokthonos hydrillicola Thurmond2011]|jgi:biliverdin reductase|uniref:Gfo/Idh/MocA family oxidoreductase n=1 Tax=Aetokthonos hydrillicola Thurmond2011 TaxID=2712845 RepID=A0AAP5I618_9CYAN|nr:Gfo/Idh/MocA family oxidoreductase [Aetokthonos hydrillicola]MBO3457509.1 Gfo/Idh/MocA family oxidoreductase [Aetokthonos hydrillicola CCALA 1050]MBW4585968.1 Gfo/Idh/MocA family oxidoreductase [Aetokthonos hydrillicola CCALA 1050]MDR9893803.1 Gfo/Idh/MocA family oxidoreductase [Aetokthonos hydrillicola Thurmond2011]